MSVDALLDQVADLATTQQTGKLVCGALVLLWLSGLAAGFVGSVPLLPRVLQSVGLCALCTWLVKRGGDSSNSSSSSQPTADSPQPTDEPRDAESRAAE